ncbi:MAG TPA: thiazolinyl imide reductase [Lachnospiraceae bacterium]|mgnify:CR=1 FL=1|nr:Gfo/Idh/MocA family oxidoreductase [uncultured Lachnoclostridium sp.]HAU87839.1 thiazolinyl imide reductase [Lachnospiraceae bacterium]
MKKKKVIVCGTGFGKVYLNAIERMEDYEIAGILGTGSKRTMELAKTFAVPCFTDPEDKNIEADCACVIVPNASGGGNGTAIAKAFLDRGIPTLLEHPAHEREIVACLKSSKTVPFMLNPFYRYISPVRRFLEAAAIIGKQAALINASLECAIHVLYDGLDMLGCAIGDVTSWKLGSVASIPKRKACGGGNKTLGAVIGDTPVMITVNTEVDKNDPDHPLHLYHRIELTFSTGRLCLVNTHGPVVWMPFLRIPRNQNETMELERLGDEMKIPSGIIIGKGTAPTIVETFEEVWTGGVSRALEELMGQGRNKKMQMAQFQIFISRLWSEVCQAVGYSEFVSYDSTGNVLSTHKALEELNQKYSEEF